MPDERFACGLLSDHLTMRGVSESQCTVIEDDPPDLVVTWENGAQWGVEVTRTYQQVESLGGGKPVSSAQTAATLRNFAEQLGEKTKDIRKRSYTVHLEGPDARGELPPQKMKQGEDDLGVASGVRRVLELVRDKAGGRSRSCAQIARNEAEVAKCTKLKREPQAVCCPPPDGDEVSVGTRQRECSDQVIARDFLGKAGQPSQLRV